MAELEDSRDGGRGAARRLGTLAQLTVLLTGMVLAVTAYSILNLLIGQMAADDSRRLSDEVRQAVAGKLGEVEQSIGAVAAMAALSPDAPEERLRDLIRDSVGGVDSFDRLFLIRFSQGHDWRSVSIFSDDTGNISQASQRSLVHSILARYERGAGGIVAIADPPGFRYWQEDADPVVRGQPFAVAGPVKSDGKTVGMVVGIVRVSGLVDRPWLAQRPSLKRFALRDPATRRILYYMSRDSGAADAEADGLGDGAYSAVIPVGDSQWQVDVVAGSDSQMRVLEKTPWLILAFGAILTIVGTLYVRNNQNQSFRLAMMNRELARKNYELNGEMAERERLNQSLRRAEREYRAIIDAVSDIIFETSIHGEIVFLSGACRKVTGFEAEQLLGQSLFDLLHPQDQEEQRGHFEMLVNGKKGAYRVFTRLRTAAGAFRSVELAMSMLRQDENRNLRVVGTFTDVEERRRAEKALSEAEKKYRTIVENAAGGIYQMTPEGQFLSANPAMARILGYETPEQMLREVRNAHDHLYVSARDRTLFIRQLESQGAVHSFEMEVRRRGGAKIWVNENARAVRDDDQNILYYEGSMEDITSRKKAELNLREAKIQSDLANRAKSEFLANMSHELRTPLNTIIGFSEIMKNQVLGPLQNPQYHEYCGHIHESGQRLLTIINEILDVSRIEAGERQLNEGVVSLDALIRSCVSFMLPKADAGRLRISNPTAGKIPNVIGEELAVKQILFNLLGNAIKFTPPDGRITISHELEPNGRLRLSVTDTGVGMDEDEIEKALTPFGQVEATHSRSASGAGLGLTLVESLIGLHGGEFEIFSQKGIGTTATIIFPARRVVPPDAGKDIVRQDAPQESAAPDEEGAQRDDGPRLH